MNKNNFERVSYTGLVGQAEQDLTLRLEIEEEASPKPEDFDSAESSIMKQSLGMEGSLMDNTLINCLRKGAEESRGPQKSRFGQTVEDKRLRRRYTTNVGSLGGPSLR